jgi:hypothetical protein
MPQVQITSPNISIFFFKVTIDLKNRNVVFDTSGSTYIGSGKNNILGISFSLVDSDGVELTSISFTDVTKYIVPSVIETFTLDLSSLNYSFLFQKYAIYASIKDQDGNVYSTEVVYKKVCEPVNFNESGYVPGIFQITADCVNDVLTVQELTNFAYDNILPTTKVKDGTFYYPTGTIAPIIFTNTPFTSDNVFTGENRVVNTTTATYDLGDDIYVEVDYITDNAFPVTCQNKMTSVLCCILDLQSTYRKNCNNSIGLSAKNKLDSVLFDFIGGILKEISGQDASIEAELVRKALNCNCGSKTIKQNEATPINPSVYNIVIQGVGGTTVPSATVTGSTKTYNIASNVYQVVKGDTGDLAYTITIDTSVAYTVKYKLTFDYNKMADYILTQFEDTPSYVTRLQNLIGAGISLAGLNGKCIIDLSLHDYVVSQTGLSGSTLISNIVINGNTYAAPANLFATDTVGITNWLNSLTFGTFSVVYSSGTLTILSIGNPNTVSTITIATPDLTIQFQSTNATLVQILQAIIDYLCGLTALQVALNANLQLCYFDYNGDIVNYNYQATINSQSDFNSGVASVICNITNRINSLAALTCARIQAIFTENPLLSFNVATDKVLGFIGGNCVQMDAHQLGIAVMNSVNSYADVKALFCAIDCSTPSTCPDVAANNVSVISGDIGVYGVTFGSVTSASQTLTVRYRVNGTLPWTVATNNLAVFANGNVSGTSPYLITGLSVGTTYDIWITNNCGGAGFVSQITTPTSTVYSGNFQLDTVIYNICGNATVPLYSSSPFAPGVTMYSDIGLTTPITGYDFIADSSGNIFQINNATGVVGVDTGSDCTTGTSGLYILGNDTGTICDGSVDTLYTDGAFAVGGTLYSDVSLTLPVTGFAYVVSGGIIYNLNSITGQIGSSTGLSCTGIYNGSVSNQSPNGNVINSVTISGVPVTYQSGDNLPQTSGDFGFFDSPIPHVPGTFGITVNVSAGINPPTLVRVTDTNGTGYDEPFIGDGNYSFPFIVFGGSSDLWRVEVDPLA